MLPSADLSDTPSRKPGAPASTVLLQAQPGALPDRMHAPLTVEIKGPVLLLMGPLGSFFSRLADFLLRNGVSTHKVMFPLREFFPGKKNIVLNYSRPMTEWRPYLQEVVARHGIRHMFMYGDFSIPHKTAIELANQLGIEAWVFELGYIRPNFVTLERDRVNARSNLNKPAAFYHSLEDGQEFLRAVRTALPIPRRWRRIFKPPCFIQHALTNYPILDAPHKLQPKLSYLYYQVRGLLRRHWYAILERKTKARLRTLPSLFLVPLQVSTDSQVTKSCRFRSIEQFITEVMESFAGHSDERQHLIFKHHPRDRGYNNYSKFIRSECRRLNVGHRVDYIHDDNLGDLLTHCKGVITINSTVGLTAIRWNVPTKVMGKTFYDLPGLTAQVSLDAFWKESCPIDRNLCTKFFNYLVETTQINGNFDGYFPFEKTFRFQHDGNY
jgi:capsular polysaccharide export protein